MQQFAKGEGVTLLNLHLQETLWLLILTLLKKPSLRSFRILYPTLKLPKSVLRDISYK